VVSIENIKRDLPGAVALRMHRATARILPLVQF
jgi:hypothetical protein